MSAATLTPASLAIAQAEFEAALPRMESAFRHALRRWPGELRREAVAGARAAAWSAWVGLVRRGQGPITVGVIGIAYNACRYVRNGRRLGTGSCGRGVMDVYHRKAQAACGFKVLSLDSGDEISAMPTTGSLWKEWLAADNRVSPADEAVFRLDFAAWLKGLPERKRQMAELLAQGHETGAVARMLGVTSPAVSQARSWLEESWRAFQGETVPAGVAPGPRRVGRPRKAGQRTPRRPGQQAPLPAMAAGS
jgi:hypothetical protein